MVNTKDISSKKKLKQIKLFESAFKLFLNKGFNETAIDDIVKDAGVAKGTFYLYFKDKYDILDRIILSKSCMVIREALEKTKEKQQDDFIDNMINFIDYIIEYFKNNKRLLKLIYKNLSWGLFRKALARPEEYEEMNNLKNIILENFKNKGFTEDEIERNIFMIMELVSSVTYSCLILNEPEDIDNMKPYLFNAVRKILTK
ncbi:transcriptional regulator, TetR family [Caloramator fervidus]|uniref:Transcriptional regulator, TetR family n=1 Tax=Caloramator fervidus TaxID=29344 RepID=A0A1H5UF37_9CLOT|nr:TetR/AcrR family transcriptional regulator [Caloramator fervidus]SEF73626.1 transcriptional regulator, TetR family [Caloramator fervidus]